MDNPLAEDLGGKRGKRRQNHIKKKKEKKKKYIKLCFCIQLGKSLTKSRQEVVVDIHGMRADLLDPLKHVRHLVLLLPNDLRKTQQAQLVLTLQSQTQQQS